MYIATHYQNSAPPGKPIWTNPGQKKPRSIHPDKISQMLGRPSTIRTNLTRWHPDKNPVVGIRHCLGMTGVLINVNVKTHIHDQRRIQRSASEVAMFPCFDKLSRNVLIVCPFPNFSSRVLSIILTSTYKAKCQRYKS